MPVPQFSDEWIRCRNNGYRRRRVNDLEMGLRWHEAAGDEPKCEEIRQKIREVESHLEEVHPSGE